MLGHTIYLPPDDEHPPRLNVPILRHLTYTEAHSAELGLYFGLILVWAAILDLQLIAFGLTAMLARKIISFRRRDDPSKRGTHDLGFHDVIQDPWYFGFMVVVVVAAYHLVV